MSADRPGSLDQPKPDPNGPNSDAGPTKYVTHTVSLGDRVRVYYDDGSFEDLPVGANPSTGSSWNQVHTTERLIDPNQIAVEEMKNKTAIGQLLGQYGGQSTLGAQQLAEGARQFDTKTALDYYNQLIQTATNPRNYVANFFLHRGQPAPDNARSYGTNLSTNDIVPFPQFLQNYMNGMNAGVHTTGAGAAAAVVAKPNAAAASPADAAIAAAFGGARPLGNGQYGVPGAGAPKPVNVGVQGSTTIPGANPVGQNTGQATQSATPQNAKPFYYDTTGAMQPLVGGGLAELYKNNPQDNPYPNAFHFSTGGVVPEPVSGVGDVSGQPYKFGEKGAEAVVPNDMFQKMLQMFKSGDLHYSEDDGKKKRSIKVNKYADGGAIGYDPNSQDPNAPPPNPYDSFGGNATGASSNTLGQMSASGVVPPFLSRLFQQGRGDQAYGTNTPQMAYLPRDVPLVSELALNQMDPSEQQALMSYVSSYGIDPNDYLGQVTKQMAPARRRQNFGFAAQ